MHCYHEGETVRLRTQIQEDYTGRFKVFYPYWNGLLSCESSQEVTLSSAQASLLNEHRRFTERVYE